MSKKENKLEYQFEVLSTLIASAYSELDKIYKNKSYVLGAELNKERHELYSKNDSIITSMLKESELKDTNENEYGQRFACELSLYATYLKAIDYSDIPELYQVYLENIGLEKKEYIQNERRIQQINEQILPFEKYMNDTQEQRNELRTAINYLLKQLDILTSSFGFHKLSEGLKIKMVKERLHRYPIDKMALLDTQKEIDAYKEAWLKRYKIHSGKMDDMPRSPKGSQISDPTGDALIIMEEEYEKIIKRSTEKVKKAADNIYWVESRLDRLSTIERRIVDLYYFNDSDERITWPDVAAQLHYTRDYCVQMEKVIISKLMSD